ncbi:hypothetical protein PG994_001374 [Apiospora phragmitis]|uniref:Magnesium transporter n=1 Tax=Apiospora phragmitis TaxID=2905665 RepID=A0ABR1WTB8_9PEZI
MARTSHAVFNRLYNCRSDTTCQIGTEDDILMSVTSFPDIPLTFGVMYGCTEVTMEFVLQYLDNTPRAALHPLMLPMMFVELERKRLIEALRTETAKLTQRIQKMETRLSNLAQQDGTPEKDDNDGDTMFKKDCQATKDWLLVSKLQNGVQSLITILDSMKTHSQEFQIDVKVDASPAGNRQIYTHNTEKFQTRLEEIEIELKSEVRNSNSLLGGMTLATQMEWNYYTRRDAKANIVIACASKMDSSQMRLISILGMVFLPGTFLATLFSMTFFKWIPEESSQVISPWIGLYCGAAVMLTLLMWRLSQKYMVNGKLVAMKEIREALDSDNDSIV